jgi:hypothetical protein
MIQVPNFGRERFTEMSDGNLSTKASVLGWPAGFFPEEFTIGRERFTRIAAERLPGSARAEVTIWLNRFVAGQGTPEPPAAPTVSQVLDGYLADRKQTVIGYETLMTNTKALKRHLGDLEPDRLTTERTRFYRGVGVPRDMRSVQPTTVETSPFRTARSCANW